MSVENVALINRWFEQVWNKGNQSAVDEMFAPNAVAHGCGEYDTPITGPAEFKKFVATLRGAFPDINIKVVETVCEGNKIAARFDVNMTHTGSSLGIPPTNKKVHVGGLLIAEIKDGQIAGGFNTWDQLGMMQQIGAIGTPAKPLK